MIVNKNNIYDIIDKLNCWFCKNKIIYLQDQYLTNPISMVHKSLNYCRHFNSERVYAIQIKSKIYEGASLSIAVGDKIIITDSCIKINSVLIIPTDYDEEKYYNEIKKSIYDKLYDELYFRFDMNDYRREFMTPFQKEENLRKEADEREIVNSIFNILDECNFKNDFISVIIYIGHMYKICISINTKLSTISYYDIDHDVSCEYFFVLYDAICNDLNYYEGEYDDYDY